MADFRTSMSHLSSAEICRQQGWGPGTVLTSEPLPKHVCRDSAFIQITGVGCASILVRDLQPPSGEDGEFLLDLHTRDWLPESVCPFSGFELEHMEVL